MPHSHPDSEQALENATFAIEELTRDRSAVSAASANLRRTRDLLLPRLVSGEVDVERMTVEG
jgi:hypothetical protein